MFWTPCWSVTSLGLSFLKSLWLYRLLNNLEKILFAQHFITLMFGLESNAPLKMVWFRKIILTGGLRDDFLQKFDISVRVNAIVRYRNSNFELSWPRINSVVGLSTQLTNVLQNQPESCFGGKILYSISVHKTPIARWTMCVIPHHIQRQRKIFRGHTITTWTMWGG